MDDSIMEISPHIFIDLTKESPDSIRHSRSCQISNIKDVSSRNITQNITCKSNCRRSIIPMVLGNTLDIQTTKNSKRKSLHATSSNEVLILDDTVKDDKTCYTIQSDDKEQISLTCPICLEALSSKLKPITTRCGHLFCSECLETFLSKSKKNCPTCKATITLKSCTRLYL